MTGIPDVMPITEHIPSIPPYKVLGLRFQMILFCLIPLSKLIDVEYDNQVITTINQGSYGSLKSMKVQDILAVKIMYLKVLNFQETVEKSIKVHIKRVLLLINNYVCYFAGASFEAIVCKKIFCGGKSHSCRRRPIILPASRSFPTNRSIG